MKQRNFVRNMHQQVCELMSESKFKASWKLTLKNKIWDCRNKWKKKPVLLVPFSEEPPQGSELPPSPKGSPVVIASVGADGAPQGSFAVGGEDAENKQYND